ncbi:MAG: hypothetical protein HYY18_22755 [Planctomycetes bacterium]|nr:hypothetical protein [Planctomycetota bacterium]
MGPDEPAASPGDVPRVRRVPRADRGLARGTQAALRPHRPDTRQDAGGNPEEDPGSVAPFREGRGGESTGPGRPGFSVSLRRRARPGRLPGRDRILGATLDSRHAGETISEVSVAMAAGAGMATLSSVVHPYPTQVEILRRAGDQWSRRRLTPRLKSFLSWFFSWRR